MKIFPIKMQWDNTWNINITINKCYGLFMQLNFSAFIKQCDVNVYLLSGGE